MIVTYIVLNECPQVFNLVKESADDPDFDHARPAVEQLLEQLVDSDLLDIGIPVMDSAGFVYTFMPEPFDDTFREPFKETLEFI